MAETSFGDMVKAVVDIEKTIMVVDEDLHADEEKILLESDSKQENLWGINIYPDNPKEQLIEFDSMINIRPNQNNRSRGVDNEEIRKKITDTVFKLIE